MQNEPCNAIERIDDNGLEGEWATSVDQFGPIRLPLNENDAQRIIAASHQAPFGKKEQTIVDTAVYRTWKLNAADFTIRNRAFEQLIKNTARTAASQLGIASSVPVRADLYKMLLYEIGAMFKPHVE